MIYIISAYLVFAAACIAWLLFVAHRLLGKEGRSRAERPIGLRGRNPAS